MTWPGSSPLCARGDAAHRDPLVWAALAVFVSLLVRTAWVCDDAYLTYRVLDNFVSGHGLRWNVADRVQAYTNPLWLLALAPWYAITRDAYYTPLVLQLVFSTLAAGLLAFRVAATRRHAALGLALLVFSKAFVDYSTSGLENPLAHLLLVLFLLVLLRDGGSHTPWLALLGGLAVWNRMDAALLVGPPLAQALLGLPRPVALRRAALAMAPTLGWMTFSLVYYGFPFPNTAYAKLNTGVPGRELAEQGFTYLLNSLSLDPLTLPTTLAGCAVGLATLRAAPASVALGVLLHLAYVVRVGGDFMSGRFLAAPFWVAVVLLARLVPRLGTEAFAGLLAAVTVVGLTAPFPNLTTTSAYFQDSAQRQSLLDDRGITDERAIYFRYTGLLTFRRQFPMPVHHRATQARQVLASGETVFRHGQAGILGFYGGRELHLIDPNGLGDAFLARLPARPGWRIGHFDRALPVGYEASLRKGGNRLDDPELRALYRKVTLVARGPLLDPERLRAIVELNLKSSRDLVPSYFAVHSTPQRARLDELQAPRPPGSPWDEGTRRFSEHGLEVSLDRLRHVGELEMSVDGNDTYRVQCLNRGLIVFDALSSPAADAGPGGLALRRVRLDATATRKGCEALRIVPEHGDQLYSLGHLHVREVGPDALQAPPSPPPPPIAGPD